MKSVLRPLMAAVIASAACAIAGAQPAPLITKPPVDTPQRVLFVGNSLLYYNGGLQTHMHRMALALDPKYESLKDGLKSVHITGAPLDQFPVDYLVKPGNLGIKQPFQVVVLASSSRDPMTEAGRTNYRRKVMEFDAAIKGIGGKTALIWLQPYSKPKWDPEGLRANGDLVMSVANEIGAYVIPIGPAFAASLKLRPDLKLQVDYDGYHPTLAGQYLSSAVTFASLYGRSPEGSSYTYFGALDKDTAVFLQKVAADTVRDFYGR